MRIFYLSFLFILTMNLAIGQTYKHGIGIHAGAFDYYGSLTGKYGYHTETNVSTLKSSKMLLWDPAIHISYWHSFFPRMDAKVGFWSSRLQYPSFDKDSNYIKAKLGAYQWVDRSPYYALDLKLIVSLLPKEKYILTPYVTTGASVNKRKRVYGFDLPSGGGINIRATKRLYFNVETNYRYLLTFETQDHLSHSVGLMYWIKGKPKKAVAPVASTAIIDPNNYDLPREANDTRDTDKDGIPNYLDQCPYHAGPAENHGCPDTDGDGVYDFEDRCPNEQGLAMNSGCPDSDSDAIVDIEDRCPAVAGKRENHGCPDIPQEVTEQMNQLASGIHFLSGKSELTMKGKLALDSISQILLTDPSLDVIIENHTDNLGKKETRVWLSQQRADACKDYLTKKGVSEKRMSGIGYGDLQPLYDNQTAEGRAKNDRTYFILKR